MGRILGLDLGTHSIGWAIVDTNENKILNLGARVLDNSIDEVCIAGEIIKIQNLRSKSRTSRFHKNSILKQLKALTKRKTNSKNFILIILSVIFATTACGLLINFANWQFWINISITVLLALLTIIHSDNKKS